MDEFDVEDGLFGEIPFDLSELTVTLARISSQLDDAIDVVMPSAMTEAESEDGRIETIRTIEATLQGASQSLHVAAAMTHLLLSGAEVPADLFAEEGSGGQ